MSRYEMLTIFQASLTEEQREQITDKYLKMIETNKGKVQVVNKWGVKKFAYPINYKKEGYYVLIEFDAEAELPKLLNDSMRIDENVVRALCIKKEI